MRYVVIIILMNIVMVCSCSESSIKKTDIERIKINIGKFIHHIDISKYYNAEFIPLELTSESLIGVINKVIATDNYIFVMDKERAHKLFMFDRKGKFIRTIGKRGKGDGEFLVLSDFDISRNMIYISSQRNNKMLKYDFEGNHIQDIKFSDYIGMGFKVLEDNSVIIKNSDGSNKSAIFYNSKGKVERLISNPEYTFLRRSTNHCFTKLINDDYMYFALNDTVYWVDNENKELTPKYVIDFGEKTFPIQNIHNKKDLSKYLEEPYMHLETYATSDHYHYFKIYDNDLFYSVLIDKASMEVLYANSFTYKGLSIGSYVGYINHGLILTWSPSSIPLIRKNENKEFNFIPKSCLNASINENPGIVILSEKNKI